MCVLGTSSGEGELVFEHKNNDAFRDVLRPAKLLFGLPYSYSF